MSIHIIQTKPFTSRRQCGCQFQFSPFVAVCLSVSASFACALDPCWGFLIVRVINFWKAFEENSPFAAYKTALLESKKKNWS